MPPSPKSDTDRPESGRHGLVTGGSAGLGLAIAQAAAAAGMQITLVARDPDRLRSAGDTLTDRFPGALVGEFAADLAIDGEPTRVVREVQEERPLDFVCHAAGLSTRGTVGGTPRADFERLMAINFFAAAELANALGEPFASSGGRLVLIGSLATRAAPAGLGAYPASKHPLAALAQQLRLELGPKGLKTLLVMPGPIARPDAGARYDTESAGLPDSARRPGGGARVEAIDPEWLAERIIRDSRRGRRELIVPAKARLLFALSQLSPSLGDWLLRRNME